jgi:hypothetical protein
MKRIFSLAIFIIAIISINQNIFAQEDEHIVAVTTWYVNNPEDGSASEYDSLATIMFDKVVSKNSKIINRSLVRHMYGSDSRQRVVITEYASMEDMELAGEEGGKLFREAFPNEEDRKAFWKAYSKYWNGHHSDEIYSMVVKK